MVKRRKRRNQSKCALEQPHSPHTILDVPSTLKNQLSSRGVHGTKPGPKLCMKLTEETTLHDHLIEAAIAKHAHKLS